MSLGLFMSKEDERSAEIRYVAESEGHRFIKLRLNPRKMKRSLRDVRLSGVMSLIGYFGGTDDSGQQKITVAIKGGDLQFTYDRQERAHIGWMLDDQTKGRFSEIGCNRDFLAAHALSGLSESRFLIDERDPHSKSTVRDVEKRIEMLKAKYSAAKEDEEMKTSISIEEIDGQMKALISKKEKAMKALIPKEEVAVGNHKAAGKLD